MDGWVGHDLIYVTNWCALVKILLSVKFCFRRVRLWVAIGPLGTEIIVDARSRFSLGVSTRWTSTGVHVRSCRDFFFFFFFLL